MALNESRKRCGMQSYPFRWNLCRGITARPGVRNAIRLDIKVLKRCAVGYLSGELHLQVIEANTAVVTFEQQRAEQALGSQKGRQTWAVRREVYCMPCNGPRGRKIQDQVTGVQCLR